MAMATMKRRRRANGHDSQKSNHLLDSMTITVRVYRRDSGIAVIVVTYGGNPEAGAIDRNKKVPKSTHLNGVDVTEYGMHCRDYVEIKVK